MSGFQKGATYEQIKTYVLEHSGLKVSSLYISQVKRKCGLDVGQNYRFHGTAFIFGVVRLFAAFSLPKG